MANGLHFIGDVKTGTSRYPSEQIKRATPKESGAWATMTSELHLSNGKQVPIYALSHRRGPSIHTFICTCGTSLNGNSVKAYFADDEERCNAEVTEYEITRKAAQVLNDFTLAQPISDRHNRYRQVTCAHA